jgi:riboflavin kinase/FMN adenylyltransferase
MKILHNLQQADIQQETVLTVGAFDGVHLGHRQLLERMMRRARETGRTSGLVTFDPLPRAVLNREGNAVCLVSLQDKIELLAQWGLDLLVVLPFTTELANTSARDFVAGLCQHLRLGELWIGWDFALGRGRTGNAAALTRLGEQMGFEVEVIEAVHEGTAVISSTEIRRLLAEGRVQEAAAMLGRYHKVRATVVSGSGRGRRLGFPTANLRMTPGCAIPAGGVFAAYVHRQGTRHPAVVNIGYRPTFHEHEYCIEAHLLDANEDLYGEEVAIELVQRLRSEHKFSDPDELVAQIRQDVEAARGILT